MNKTSWISYSDKLQFPSLPPFWAMEKAKLIRLVLNKVLVDLSMRPSSPLCFHTLVDKCMLEQIELCKVEGALTFVDLFPFVCARSKICHRMPLPVSLLRNPSNPMGVVLFVQFESTAAAIHDYEREVRMNDGIIL